MLTIMYVSFSAGTGPLLVLAAGLVFSVGEGQYNSLGLGLGLGSNDWGYEFRLPLKLQESPILKKRRPLYARATRPILKKRRPLYARATRPILK